MKADQTKTERNEELYQLKAVTTFAALAKRFNISMARVKDIYYRMDAIKNPGRKKKRRAKKKQIKGD
jgi:uncharacterized membrane protein